jgi:hypothetical protein
MEKSNKPGMQKIKEISGWQKFEIYAVMLAISNKDHREG